MSDAYIPIRVMIADDHEVYREGIKTLLGRFNEVEIIGEASNGQEVVAQCKDTPPDIVLMDIMMPTMDGIEATAYLNKNIPSVRVIALSMFNQDNLVLDMLNAGALGYLIKNSTKNEIKEAIESVYKNIPYYCRNTSMKLARLIGGSQFGTKIKDKIIFSVKELTIIKYLCEELTTKEIAEVMKMSPRTVEEYRQNIRDKMKVKGTTGIVIYSIKNGLIKLP